MATYFSASESFRALADHIEMAVGQRVNRAGIERGARRGGCHGGGGIGDFASVWKAPIL